MTDSLEDRCELLMKREEGKIKAILVKSPDDQHKQRAPLNPLEKFLCSPGKLDFLVQSEPEVRRRRPLLHVLTTHFSIGVRSLSFSRFSSPTSISILMIF